MSVLICNRFGAMQANSGKVTTFKGVPFFQVLVQRESLRPGARNFVTINQSFVTANGEDLVILSCTVLIGLKGVTGGRTDGQTDRQTPRR